MNSQNILIQIDKILNEISDIEISKSGKMKIVHGGPYGTYFFSGDQAAFLRLGLAMLSYGVKNLEVSEGDGAGNFEFFDEFFDDQSRVMHIRFTLDIHDSARTGRNATKTSIFHYFINKLLGK